MAVAGRSDEAICDDVCASLAWDRRLNDDDIQVAVAGGVVTLMGSVPTLAQRLIAAEDAWRIKGVVEVVNQLQVRPEALPSQEELAAAIYEGLRADPRVDETSIVVNISGGVVQLTGAVTNPIARQAAAEAAWRVPGVVEVLNDLTVAPGGQRADREIEEDVRAALLRDALIADPTGIQLVCRGGVVQLTGRVRNERERVAAEQDAWFTAGVVRVDNRLTTTGE